MSKGSIKSPPKPSNAQQSAGSRGNVNLKYIYVDAPNHKVTISGAGRTLTGLLDDDSLSFNMGVQIEDSGASISGLLNAFKSAGGGKSTVGNVLAGASGVLEGLGNLATGLGIKPENFLVAKTIKMPQGFDNPKITFKMTQFASNKNTFKGFIDVVSRIILPKKTAGDLALWSNQISYDEFAKLKITDLTAGVSAFAGIGDLATFDGKFCGIKIGKFFGMKYGWWCSNVDVEVPTKFDSNGRPIIWSATFSFDYWRQLDYIRFQQMFNK